MKTTICHSVFGWALCLIIVAGLFPIQNGRAHDGEHLQIEQTTREIEQEPQDGRLRLKRADLYRRHGDVELARQDCLKAEALGADPFTLHLCRGRIFLAENQYALALPHADACLALNPKSGDALLLRARAQEGLGHHASTAETYARLIDLFPKDRKPLPEYYLARAKAWHQAGQPKKALTGVNQGIERIGGVISLHHLAIELEVETGNLDAALDRIEGIRKSSTRPAFWQVRSAELLLQANRTGQARKALREAQASLNDFPPGRRNVRATRQLQTKIAAISRELSKEPHSPKGDRRD